MLDTEPQVTIYGPHWVRATHQLDALPDAVRGAFARMLAKMEEGWKFAGAMQAAVEAGPGRDGYTHTEVVYYAAEVLIVDLFRTLALELAGAVPDMEEGCAPDVMLDDVESESELLMRYLIMTEATLAHPRVAERARAELLGPTIGLRDMDGRVLAVLEGDGGRAVVVGSAGAAPVRAPCPAIPQVRWDREASERLVSREPYLLYR